MKKIALTNGQVALVDDADYEWITKRRWYASKGRANNKFVAKHSTTTREGKKIMFLMHREIMKPPRHLTIDHINGDSLDNRRCNLRFATVTENNRNMFKVKKRTAIFSKYKGVGWNKAMRKWQASIGYDKTRKHLGYYESEDKAAMAYNKAAKIHHRDFANLNIIRPNESPVGSQK